MSILEHLIKIYGDDLAKKHIVNFEKIVLESKNKAKKLRKCSVDETDIVLITYADQFNKDGEEKIKTFQRFAEVYLKDVFEIIHFLPFFPYSSDDGFSVIDYMKIKDDFGEWKDLEKLSDTFTLMYDFVCNHISAQSEWFKEYCNGNHAYENFFIEVENDSDLTMVTRPRTSQLLTQFDTKNGKKNIWTTFSSDQVDLNFENPLVLLKMLEVLLVYIDRGGSWIRLDAIGFMWKEIGTTCIHHPKTHEIVKLFRSVIDEVFDGVKLITETNVPHLDNISYFGNGNDESHMVYQFPLPPLVLYSFLNQESTTISAWAKTLTLPTENTHFFNFLASHDGIGVNPIRGIVPESEIVEMVEKLQNEAGALISYKIDSNGALSPYEINVSYFSAIKCLSDDELAVEKFVNAQSLLLGLAGVPAIYIHSLLGSRNYTVGPVKTQQNRTINRKKNQIDEMTTLLNDPTTTESKVYHELVKLIKIRKKLSAFNPNSSQEICSFDDRVFAFVRTSDFGDKVMCLHNFSEGKISIVDKRFKSYTDLLNDDKEVVSEGAIDLLPYSFKWIKF